MPKNAWTKDEILKLETYTLNCWLAEAQGWEISPAGYDSLPYWRDEKGFLTGFSPDPLSRGLSYYNPVESLKRTVKALKNLSKRYQIEIESSYKVEVCPNTGERKVVLKTRVMGRLDKEQGLACEVFDGGDPETLVRAILWAVGKIDESRG